MNSRRNFLQQATALTVGGALLSHSSWAESFYSRTKLPETGIQLFTILMQMETDAAGSLQKLAAARRGRVLAEVTSAIALTSDQEQRLTTALTAIYKQEVQVQVVIDKKVIGGVAVRVGDEVIDGTVANRLAQVRRQLAG